MPILGIVDRSERLVQFAPTIIAAAMLSPNNERRRNEIEATGYVDTALQVNHPIPAKIFTHTHLGPGTHNLLKEAQSQGYLGWIAGQILFFVLRCAIHQPGDATTGRAVRVIQHVLAREARLQKRDFSSSESKIWDAWGKYKCVSHLWSALLILEKGEDGLNIENLPEILSMAEFLRSQGERHYPPPKRAKAEPLLDPKKTWKSPEGLKLPHTSFSSPPLSNQETGWLAEYRTD